MLETAALQHALRWHGSAACVDTNRIATEDLNQSEIQRLTAAYAGLLQRRSSSMVDAAGERLEGICEENSRRTAMERRLEAEFYQGVRKIRDAVTAR